MIKKLRLAGKPRFLVLISPKLSRVVMQRFCLNAENDVLSKRSGIVE